MKQSLQLKIGQQLKMTPQLQQAIRLLQLSTLDLQQEIQEALDSNPMLEVDEEMPSQESSADNLDAANHDSSNSKADSANNTDDDSAQFDDGASFDKDEQWQEQIPEKLSTDSDWDDVFQNSAAVASGPAPSDGEFDFDYKNSKADTLQDHLMWQLNVTQLVATDEAMAMAIIDAVEPTGFLSAPAQEIYDSLTPELDVEFEEFEAVRQMIQQFDPVGVASEGLRECLLVQLKQFPPNTAFVNDAMTIVDSHLHLLATHDYAQLKRKTRFKEGRLKEAITLIQSLTPHPGDMIESSTTEYIVPDVFVKKIQGHWTLELNNDCAPQIRINESYAGLVKRADNSDDNNFLRDNLQEARWFIKSLQSRNETLIKVATRIVEHQIGFLEYGEEAMKPLVLADIAESIDMHESTVSRVTTRKYMHTPRGVFELKYFFSSHVSTAEGGECSSTAIRAIIKKFVASENPQKPLSDNKIANMLTEQGIKVARRTVAKYRESMAIPPSNERKRLG
ncbi:RNA polymerase sigma-54 factor [BD1-7 clade bacterium]|uniref:RNA polymerase sigma-54 factor n=1 Tax=BD1-7 clade bacterium TaxID=2029982 RepID=A0A5S9MQE6_9GAMM|nr:RNA polymerase sigma-54 factor [BD1-7 clade bacterium]CAA0084844.1 RNA polymerase sigma-54 factor [BD1-7 clade bacterium]